MKRRLLVAAAPAALALIIAGCGSSNSSDSSSSSGSAGSTSGSTAAASTTASSATGATVRTTKGDLGTYLVDSKGRTLYLFEADKNGRSACSGDCATDWPPVTTSGAPVAGTGVTAGWLSTTKRADGTTQVTYAGHPLYTFAGDRTVGQTRGQGVDAAGAEWYVVSGSTGNKIDNDDDSDSDGGS